MHPAASESLVPPSLSLIYVGDSQVNGTTTPGVHLKGKERTLPDLNVGSLKSTENT